MDVSALLETTLTGLGYELAGWERSAQGRMMRVFVDKPEGQGNVNLDDCTKVSQHLTRLFAVEGVDYDRLEVSSPGLDRLLTRERDFVRFTGEKARIKLRIAHEGQRNFTGVLRAVNDGKVELEADGRMLAFELGNIDRARLIPNI